jgi:hypothetical protein
VEGDTLTEAGVARATPASRFPRTDTNSDRRAERDLENAESSGTCNAEAHNIQGDVKLKGQNETISLPAC